MSKPVWEYESPLMVLVCFLVFLYNPKGEAHKEKKYFVPLIARDCRLIGEAMALPIMASMEIFIISTVGKDKER